jgi:Phosphorylase b kinase C-terminal domain
MLYSILHDVLQMTANEVKFALQIEAIFNKITQPEYRQLMVEAIMILCLLVQHDGGGRCRWNEIIVVDKLVQRANEIFIKEQVYSWHLVGLRVVLCKHHRHIFFVS